MVFFNGDNYVEPTEYNDTSCRVNTRFSLYSISTQRLIALSVENITKCCLTIANCAITSKASEA